MNESHESITVEKKGGPLVFQKHFTKATQLYYLKPPSLCPGLLVLQILHFVRFAQLMLPHLK